MPLDKVCDGNEDCVNGADEWRCKHGACNRPELNQVSFDKKKVDISMDFKTFLRFSACTKWEWKGRKKSIKERLRVTDFLAKYDYSRCIEAKKCPGANGT